MSLYILFHVERCITSHILSLSPHHLSHDFVFFYVLFPRLLCILPSLSHPILFLTVLWILIRMFLGPPGSESFHQQAKIVRKTLISTIFLLLFDFLSFEG